MPDYIRDVIDTAAVQSDIERTNETSCAVKLSSPDGELMTTLELAADAKTPSVEEAMYRIAIRLQLVEDTDDYLEWVDELGLSAGDPATLDKYKTLVGEIDDLKRVLGSSPYEKLMGGLAVYQAVSRARESFLRNRKR